MANFNTNVFRKARVKKNWKQEKLAHEAGVHVSTIVRLEAGQIKNFRGRAIMRLMDCLGIKDSDLQQIEHNDKLGLSRATNNALFLLSERYKISPQEILEAAPLLFYIAAEQSLREREKHVAELRAAAERLRELQVRTPYLAQSLAVDEANLRREELSIQERDLFGFRLMGTDNEFCEEYDSLEINPLIISLRRALEEARPDTPEDNSSLTWFKYPNQTGAIDYSICREEAAALVGGDEIATQAILYNRVALSEMPMDFSPEERAQWVRNALDLTPADVNDEASDETPEPLTDDDDDIDDDNGDWETPDRGAIH
jgi:transcriptional regulator with XRE-family HTH domain